MSVHGFTPINSGDGPRLPQIPDESSGQSCDFNDTQTTIVSEYLGRGKPTTPSHLAAVLRKRPKKKRKRNITTNAATTGEETTPDSRTKHKTVDPEDDASTTAPTSGIVEGRVSIDQDKNLGTDMELAVQDEQLHDVAVDEQSDQATLYIPLATPATSMNSHPKERLTSIEAVQAAPYSSVSSPSLSQEPSKQTIALSFEHGNAYTDSEPRHAPFGARDPQASSSRTANRLSTLSTPQTQNTSTRGAQRAFCSAPDQSYALIRRDDGFDIDAYEDFAALQKPRPSRSIQKNVREVSPSFDYQGALLFPRESQNLRLFSGKPNLLDMLTFTSRANITEPPSHTDCTQGIPGPSHGWITGGRYIEKFLSPHMLSCG